MFFVTVQSSVEICTIDLIAKIIKGIFKLTLHEYLYELTWKFCTKALKRVPTASLLCAEYLRVRCSPIGHDLKYTKLMSYPETTILKITHFFKQQWYNFNRKRFVTVMYNQVYNYYVI